MSQFKLGATYKMNSFLALMMGATVGAKFKSGAEHTFTVHALSTEEDTLGAAYTDDITSEMLPSRCLIPPYIVENCELVSEPCKCGNPECKGCDHG